MRIDLALQHLVFQILFLFLIFQSFLHKFRYIFRQIIDSPSDIPKFVIPFHRRVSGEVSAGDAYHPCLQPRYRYRDHTIHQQHQNDTDRQNADQDAGKDSHEQNRLIGPLRM